MDEKMKGLLSQAVVDENVRNMLIGQVKTTIGKFKSDEGKAAFKAAMVNPEARTALMQQLAADPLTAPIVNKIANPETQAAMVAQFKKKYKGSFRDQWVDFKYWMIHWKAVMAQPKDKEDKHKMQEAMMKYPWMLDFMKNVHMVKAINEGRTGTALKMSWKMNVENTKAVVQVLQDIILDPDNTVMAHVMLPTEIYQAMGLKFYWPEVPGNLLAMMDQNSHLYYIDHIQSCGLPEDTCPYASQTPGVVLAGHSPVSNTCMVVANLACEGGYASYGLIEDYFGLPSYHVEIPYDFKTAAGKERVAEELKGLIAFLEEHTGHKMDWDKLKEILERGNQITEMEMEFFEMQQAELPPMPGDVLWQLHMIFVNAIPGTEMSLNLYKELQKLSRKAYALQEPAVKNRKYRAILWNPPSFGYSHIWNWMERCWGVAIVNDMETFLHLPLIDTSTPDSMLLGLAEHYSNAPMSRNNRGPAENWLDDLNTMTSMYRPDFVLDLNQMACRSSLALNGVMKEWGREKNVPICFVDYNLYDMRVVSRQGIRDQINNFMLNVMKATPLDESLLDFDDSTDW